MELCHCWKAPHCVMCHMGVNFVVKLTCTLFLGIAMFGCIMVWQSVEHFLSVDGPGMWLVFRCPLLLIASCCGNM